MKFFYIKFQIWILSYSGHNSSCISNEACVIPLPETFYFNDVCNQCDAFAYSTLDYNNVPAACLVKSAISRLESVWNRDMYKIYRVPNDLVTEFLAYEIIFT